MNISPLVKAVAVAAPATAAGALLTNAAFENKAGTTTAVLAGSFTMAAGGLAALGNSFIGAGVDSIYPARAIGGAGIGLMVGALAAMAGSSYLAAQ